MKTNFLFKSKCFLVIVCFRQEKIESNAQKTQIIATLFPQYDFAKHIVGNKAEVKLLLNLYFLAILTP